MENTSRKANFSYFCGVALQLKSIDKLGELFVE